MQPPSDIDTPAGGAIYLRPGYTAIEVDESSRWGWALSALAGSEPEVVTYRRPARSDCEPVSMEERAWWDRDTLRSLTCEAIGRGLTVVAVGDLRLEEDRRMRRRVCGM